MLEECFKCIAFFCLCLTSLPSWRIFGHFGAMLDPSWSDLGNPGLPWRFFCEMLRPCWAQVGTSLAILGPSWLQLWPSWLHLGLISLRPAMPQECFKCDVFFCLCLISPQQLPPTMPQERMGPNTHGYLGCNFGHLGAILAATLAILAPSWPHQPQDGGPINAPRILQM